MWPAPSAPTPKIKQNDWPSVLCPFSVNYKVLKLLALTIRWNFWKWFLKWRAINILWTAQISSVQYIQWILTMSNTSLFWDTASSITPPFLCLSSPSFYWPFLSAFKQLRSLSNFKQTTTKCHWLWVYSLQLPSLFSFPIKPQGNSSLHSVSSFLHLHLVFNLEQLGISQSFHSKFFHLTLFIAFITSDYNLFNHFS